MIKAAFFDIDGTLIDPETYRIPESTIQSLQKLRERGIKLFVATGRIKSMVGFLDEAFSFDGYLTLNGQYCYDRTGLIHKMAIPAGDIRQLQQILRETPFPCLLIEEEESFFVNFHEKIRIHFAHAGLPVPEPYEESRLDAHEVLQFLAYIPPEQRGLLDPLKNIEITSAGDFCFDVIPKGGGKEKGIEAVIRHYGIRREEIMVFGDGDNDVRMIRYAGTGVAMGNAREETKAAADYVTDTAGRDGIEKALLHFNLI